MQKAKHSTGKRTLLSPSSASRWLRCTPSALLERQYGESKTSEYAEEGTAAHKLLECYLKYSIEIKTDGQSDWWDYINEFKQLNDYYNEEMDDCIRQAFDYISDVIGNSKPKFRAVELKVPLESVTGEADSNGLIDHIIVIGSTLHIMDYKHGKGVEVSAVDNDQLTIYALAALASVKEAAKCRKVVLHIMQPRKQNFSRFELGISELYRIRDKIKEKAGKALKGEGELCAGEHCRFCSIRGRCRKIADYCLSIPIDTEIDLALLSLKELGQIYSIVDTYDSWVKSFRETVFKLAVDGKKIPGCKLVKGNGRRVLTDLEGVKDTLSMLYPKSEFMKPPELKPMTALEKLLGKSSFAEVLGEYIIYQEGRPTLVSENDSRKEYLPDSAESDFSNLYEK